MENNQEVIPVALRIDLLKLDAIDLPAETSRAPVRPRAGDLCPKCQIEHLDYDGLLNLSCPKCGLVAGGCFT